MIYDQIDNNIINSNYDNNVKDFMLDLNDSKKIAINSLSFKTGFKDYVIDYKTDKAHQIKSKIIRYYNKSGRKSAILKSMIIELSEAIEHAHRSTKIVNANHIANFSRMSKVS